MLEMELWYEVDKFTRDHANDRLDSVSAEQYREAITRFATGVAIVSTRTYKGDVHGATVNSLTSISINPPTIMVSLGYASKARRYISQEGWYGVSILEKSQKDYCVQFSGSRKVTAATPAFVQKYKAPTLRHSAAWMECTVVKAVEVYDHTLFFGKVVACGASADCPPLMFLDSALF